MPVTVNIVHQGENVYFLTLMRTECVLQYQKSTHCVPNVNFADLFGSTGKHNLDLNYNLMGFDTIEINLVVV